MTFSSKWQWNGIDLWVYEFNRTRDIKRAELFVLDDTSSSFHFFGAGSAHYTLKGRVVGATNVNSIITDAIGNTPRTLTGPTAGLTFTNVKIHGAPKFNVMQYAGATLGGVDYTTDTINLYEFEMELVQT